VPAIIRSAEPEDRCQLFRIPSALRFLNHSFLVAIDDARVVAFLAWRRLVPGECEILQLETLPPFRRRGLARLLVRELKKQERGDLFLEVRPSNVAACKLYESEGFTLIGVRREYYSDPSEDGIVLRFHPC
jgi:[ribosomal protein S18]-alanine N-acetyltransferase